MKIDLTVLKRYFEGVERENDFDQILYWFSDFRYEKDLLKNCRLIWEDLKDDDEIEISDRSEILGRIFYQIKQDEYKELPKKKNLRSVLNAVSKIAAVLFIPLLVCLCIQTNRNSSISNEKAYSEIYCPLGTRTMFYLPDGSRGWLNGGSSLKFPTKFSGKTRKVSLQGEGYFDVETNNSKPFVVMGEQIAITAHGTTFNVQVYPEDPEIRITLINGKVTISDLNNGKRSELASLTPGQMFTYYSENGLYQLTKVDSDYITGWKDGKLAFRNENFSEVVKKINRWYNVDIQIMDKVLESYNFRATFEDETLDEVLKLLQRSSPLTYRDFGKEKRADYTFGKRKIKLYFK